MLDVGRVVLDRWVTLAGDVLPPVLVRFGLTGWYNFTGLIDCDIRGDIRAITLWDKFR